MEGICYPANLSSPLQRRSPSRDKEHHVCLCNLIFKTVLHPSQVGEYTEAIICRQFGTDGPQERASRTAGVYI